MDKRMYEGTGPRDCRDFSLNKNNNTSKGTMGTHWTWDGKKRKDRNMGVALKVHHILV